MLVPILADLPVFKDPRVLVGFEHADDAGVYLLRDDLAVVQTVDFFTPVVDDPGLYGQIAAANALSDIYAMGGQPIFALSVVGFPSGSLEPGLLREIVRGGALKMMEAGVPIIGGHSVQDPELKFGYCVTGTVHPDRIWTNSGARPGDLLFLTKPLGTGIITTGVKFGLTPPSTLEPALKVMLELNSSVSGALQDVVVHAATDITGYGLLGHAFEMAQGSDVTLLIDPAAVSILPGTLELAEQGAFPGGIRTNRNYVGDSVDWSGLDEKLRPLFLDPQTSGGLLLSLSPEAADQARARAGTKLAAIGRVLPRETRAIRFA